MTDKKTFTEEEIRAAASEATEYTFNFDYINILVDITERALDGAETREEAEDAICEAIHTGLIYNGDRWTVYQYHCDIGDSEEEMYECFYEDIYTVIKILFTGSEG